MTDTAKRKREWLNRKGLEYRRNLHKKLKEYQDKPAGKLAWHAGNLNSSTKKRGGEGKVTMGNLVNIFFRMAGLTTDEVICERCGRWTEKWFWDHIVAVGLHGGKNVEENIQILCPDCHDEKTRKERNDAAYPDYQTSLFTEEVSQ